MKKVNNDLSFNYSMIDKNFKKGYIALAPVWKRALAGLIDFLLGVFVFLSIFFGTREIFVRTSYVNNINNEFSIIMKESGLFTYENNEFTLIDSKNYIDYRDAIYTFYNQNLKKIDENSKEKDIYWFNVYLLGQDDERNLFDDENINRYKFVKENGTKFFEYNINELGEKEYDKFAIIKKELYIDGLLPEKTYNDILNYFCSMESNCVYAVACNDLYATNKYQSLRNEYSKFYAIYPIYIGLPVTYFIIYILPILIFRNGETFGKKMLSLCLVNEYGYRSSKFKNIFRMFIPVIFLFIIFIFYPLIALILLILLIFVSFLMMIFTNMHRSLFDFCGLTLCIDNKESIWFETKEDQINYEKDMQSIHGESENNCQ